MSKHKETGGPKTFFYIWAGQLISTVGSRLSTFALGIWVYEATGSVTRFALIIFSTYLPIICFSPIAGVLVDRWNRRWAMIISDIGAGLSAAILMLLLYTSRLESWNIYLLLAVGSIFGSIRWPAYMAAITLLIPKKHLGRANGMVQMGDAIAEITAPILGVILLGAIHIEGIVLINFATFVFAVLTLAVVRIPSSSTSNENARISGALLNGVSLGWAYIIERPGLVSLLLYFAALNLYLGMVEVLITPLVLSFTSTAMLGTILLIGGTGMLIGSITMSVWGGPKRRVNGVLGLTFIQGLVLMLGGLPPSIFIISSAAFIYFFGVPIVNGCVQAIWQIKVPADLQGRVFAVRRMITSASLPFAYLIAGPLADYVFQPLVVEGGPLAGTVGRIIGVGPGRGIGLLFVLLGLLIVASAIYCWLYPHFREMEDELADAIPNKPKEETLNATASIPV